MDLWGDVAYIYEFLQQNIRDIPKGSSLESMVMTIMEDTNQIDDVLMSIIETEDVSLSHFFKPLYNLESGVRVLSLQKGRAYSLRVYAIKVDADTFVITGGAIKLPLQHLMEDRELTTIELKKLNNAKSYLREQGICDDESFFEFLTE